MLGILLLGFLVAKVARRCGKNSLVWGIFTVIAVTTITWQQLPVWMETIFFRGKISQQSNTGERTVIDLAEAQRISIPLSMDGVYFDVPLVYNFKGYSQQLHGWQNVPRKLIEGKKRPVVDFIKIDTMLPDISPLREENLAQFEKLAWEQNVHASITHGVSWDDYFKYFFEKLQRQPDSMELPGMLHYYDPAGQADIFLSHDHPSDEFVRIRCPDKNLLHKVIPVCIVEAPYYPALGAKMETSRKTMVFHLRYELPGQYIAQWSTIGQKLQSRFNQMVNVRLTSLP